MVTSRTIGPYTLEAPLGQGGMGETWLAVRESAGQFRRHCCVKILRSELRSEASALAQFRDEARIHALLHHDAIVQVYDFGEDEEGCYLVMEYVQGCDLRQLLARYHGRKQRIPMRLAVYIAAELLQALDYAHRACDHQGTPLKLVHRDISPANILLTATGRVKLTDFGISTFVDRTARTKTGFVVGKPGYFAPEQADPTATREGRLDARTDLFAVGVVMYEMFAGTAPFAKQAPADPQAPWDCTPLEQMGTALDEGMGELVERMLSEEPEDRPSSAAAALAQLRQISIPDSTMAGALSEQVQLTTPRRRAAGMPTPTPSPRSAALDSWLQQGDSWSPAAAASSAARSSPASNPLGEVDEQAELASGPLIPGEAAQAAGSPAASRLPLIAASAAALALIGYLSWPSTPSEQTQPSTQRIIERATVPANGAPAPAAAAELNTATAAPTQPAPRSPAPAAAEQPAAATEQPPAAPADQSAAKRTAKQRADKRRAQTTRSAAKRTAAAKPSPPAAKKASALGTLDVFATPWGHIWVDGRYVGRDRISLPVSAGSHRVGVGTDRDAGPQQTRRVRVAAGKSMDVELIIR